MDAVIENTVSEDVRILKAEFLFMVFDCGRIAGYDTVSISVAIRGNTVKNRQKVNLLNCLEQQEYLIYSLEPLRSLFRDDGAILLVCRLAR